MKNKFANHTPPTFYDFTKVQVLNLSPTPNHLALSYSRLKQPNTTRLTVVVAPSTSLMWLNTTWSTPYKLHHFSPIKRKQHNLFPHLSFEWKGSKAEILELNSWNTDTTSNPKELSRDSEHFEWRPCYINMLHQLTRSYVC